MLLALAVVWLAWNVVTTGVAGYLERRGDGSGALAWRPQSSAALSLDAGEALTRGDLALASRQSKTALLRSPLEVRAVRVLGLAEAARGRDDQAQALMERAGRLSRRDTQTNAWLFDHALERKRYREAFRHADVLMRRSEVSEKALMWRLSAAMDSPKARVALAAQLESRPPWRRRLLQTVTQSGASANAADLLEVLARGSLPPTDDEIAPLFHRLVSIGQAADAARYWSILTRLPPRSGPPYVYDGGFEGLPGPEPLNWQKLDVAGGAVAWKTGAGRPLGRLRLRHDGFSSSGVMVQQVIYLPPGPFDVKARASIADPVADRRFRLEIVCSGGSKLTTLQLQGRVGEWIGSEANFEVPADGCPWQWLTFRPNTGERRELAEIDVDDVAIIRAD